MSSRGHLSSWLATIGADPDDANLFGTSNEVCRKGLCVSERFRAAAVVAMVVVVQKRSSSTTNTTAGRDFAALIEPLERASGRRLGNPARRECLKAYTQHPVGVARVAAGALFDAARNPVGLFVYRIANDWHELEPLENEQRQRNANGVCSHAECAFQSVCIAEVA
jgi:hypothetical protein